MLFISGVLCSYQWKGCALQRTSRYDIICIGKISSSVVQEPYPCTSCVQQPYLCTTRELRFRTEFT